MKKRILGIMAAAVVSLALASCGEKLLTDEQVQAEIQKGFDAGKGVVETEENAKCETEFENRVNAAVEQMKMESEAAQPASGK